MLFWDWEDALQDAIAHDVSVAVDCQSMSATHRALGRFHRAHVRSTHASAQKGNGSAVKPDAARAARQPSSKGRWTHRSTSNSCTTRHVWTSQERTKLQRGCQAIKVTDELNPQFARVYEAAGNMVKRENGYAAFCTLESRFFDELNKKQKPAQPVSSVYKLQTLSIRSKLEMDALMLGVRDEVDQVCSGGRGGNDSKLALGGVVWSAAP